VASAFRMSSADITFVRTGVLASNFGVRVPVTTTCSISMGASRESGKTSAQPVKGSKEAMTVISIEDLITWV
jgi:hypothetical protein